MTKETAMKILKELHDNSLFSNRIALETLIPELADSNDERIRKCLIDFFEDWHENKSHCWGIAVTAILAWLEKQGESYTKKDVDDAYLKGICDAKHELEKQGEQKPVDKVEPFDKYEGLTDFERTLADICIGWIGEELGWKQYIKDSADVLLKIAIKKFNSIQDAPFEQKSAAWSDEDEKMANDLIEGFQSQVKVYNLVHTSKEIADWLKSLKNRVQPQVKEWSEEDELVVLSIEQVIKAASLLNIVPEKLDKIDKWLKSLKDGIGE